MRKHLWVVKKLDALFIFEGPGPSRDGRRTLKSGGAQTYSTDERQACVRHGGVAQLGEHLPCKQGVDSSILFISTIGCFERDSRTHR